jgi:hypothetical protein
MNSYLPLYKDQSFYAGNLTPLLNFGELKSISVLENSRNVHYPTLQEDFPGSAIKKLSDIKVEVLTPQISLIEICNARLVSNYGLIYAGESYLNHNSWLLRFEGNSVVNKLEENGKCNISDSVDEFKGKIFSPFLSDWKNYAHWVYQVLPALIYYKENLMPMGIKMSVSRMMLEYFSRQRFHGQSLRLVFGDNFTDCMIVSENIKPESLMFIIGLNVGGNFSNLLIHNSISLVKNQAAKLEQNNHKNIYFSRTGSGRRNIINNKKFLEIISDFKFIEVNSSELNFSEQLVLSYNAENIIGVHGANLANALFCKNLKNLIEIHAIGMGYDGYRNTAIAIGSNYYSVSQPAVEDNVSSDLIVCEDDIFRIMNII